MKKALWDSSAGCLSEKSVRGKYHKRDLYRISRADYPAGAHVNMECRAHLLHVISGTIRISKVGMNPLVIVGGEVVHVPSGEFLIEVSDDSPVSTVSVWSLKSLEYELN